MEQSIDASKTGAITTQNYGDDKATDKKWNNSMVRHTRWIETMR